MKTRSCWMPRFVLTALSFACGLSVIAQPWLSPQAVPVFRGTEAQGLAIRKLGDSSICLARLGTLSSAAQNYAADNGDRLPAAWRDFTNSIAQPIALYCPADLAHPAQTNWADVDLSAISHEVVAPGADRAGPSQQYIRCTFHGNFVTTRGARTAARPYDSRRFPLTSTNSINLPLPAFLTAREGAVSLECIRNLQSIGLAARIFASDHNGFMPSSFAEMADSLDSPQVLVCPSDLLRTAAATWAALGAANITYRIDAPGVRADFEPKQPFSTCPIHGHHVDTDGSVAQGTNRFPPRLITGHPLSWTVEPGQPLELAVLTGDPGLAPFSYQWRRLQPFDSAGEPFTNTVVLTDATNRTHRIAAASAADEGYYDVIVNDAQGGYQFSHMAYVRVEPLANVSGTLTWEPIACVNNLKGIGLAARMFASANAERAPDSFVELIPYVGWPLSVFCPNDTNRTAPNSWEAVNFDNVSYTFEPGVPAEPGTSTLATCKVHGYWVQADGVVKYGDAPPAVYVHPLSQMTFKGRTVSLRVGAIGDERSYEWFKDGELIAGETDSTLTFVASETRSFHAVVTNPWGVATSRVATVTVQAIPRPTLEFSTLNAGAEFSLRLTAPAGVVCVVEASPDLVRWTGATTIVMTDAQFLFTQGVSAAGTKQFYRAVLR